MSYDFTTKQTNVYSLDNSDWVKQLDKQHEYGFILAAGQINFGVYNCAKINFLRINTMNLENFNL